MQPMSLLLSSATRFIGAGETELSQLLHLAASAGDRRRQARISGTNETTASGTLYSATWIFI